MTMYRQHWGENSLGDVSVLKEIDGLLRELDNRVKATSAFKSNTRGGTLWPMFKTAIEKKDWIHADRLSDDISEVLQVSTINDQLKRKLRELVALVGRLAKDIKAEIYEDQGPNSDENTLEESLVANAESSLVWFTDAIDIMCQEINKNNFNSDASFLQEPRAQSTSVSPLLNKLRVTIRTAIHERDVIEKELVLWFRLCADHLEQVVKQGSARSRRTLEMPDTPPLSLRREQMDNLERSRQILTSALCKVEAIIINRESYPHKVTSMQETYSDLTVEYEKKMSVLNRKLTAAQEENRKYQKEIDSLQRKLHETTRDRPTRGSSMDIGSKQTARELELEKFVAELKIELEQYKDKKRESVVDERQREFSKLTGPYEKQIASLREDLSSLAEEGKRVERLVQTSRNTIGLAISQTRDTDSVSQSSRDWEAESRVRELETRVEDLQSRLQANTSMLAKAEEEKEAIKTRLSQMMGSQMQDVNPELTDLSDEYRPVKLAEMYQELYDNQWTDSFDSLTDVHKMDDMEAIEKLLEILKECYEFCKEEEDKQMKAIVGSLYVESGLKRQSEDEIPKPTTVEKMRIYLKGARIQISTKCIQKKYIESRKAVSASESEFSSCLPYVRRCLELCWYMVLHVPPVSLDTKTPNKIKADRYRFYTRSGILMDYVVWPPLLLGKDGKLLCKGVAQAL